VPKCWGAKKINTQPEKRKGEKKGEAIGWQLNCRTISTIDFPKVPASGPLWQPSIKRI